MRTVPVCLVALLLLIPAPAQAHPGVYVAKFFGEYLAGKGLDALFDSVGLSGEDRVKELNIRLGSYESSLRQVDAKMADQVASLRRELSTKTTASTSSGSSRHQCGNRPITDDMPSW